MARLGVARQQHKGDPSMSEPKQPHHSTGKV